MLEQHQDVDMASIAEIMGTPEEFLSLTGIGGREFACRVAGGGSGVPAIVRWTSLVGVRAQLFLETMSLDAQRDRVALVTQAFRSEDTPIVRERAAIPGGCSIRKTVFGRRGGRIEPARTPAPGKCSQTCWLADRVGPCAS